MMVFPLLNQDFPYSPLWAVMTVKAHGVYDLGGFVAVVAVVAADFALH